MKTKIAILMLSFGLFLGSIGLLKKLDTDKVYNGRTFIYKPESAKSGFNWMLVSGGFILATGFAILFPVKNPQSLL